MPRAAIALAAVAALSAKTLVAAAPVVTTYPQRPDDLFRFLGDNRPIELVLSADSANDMEAAAKEPALFAYTYGGYHGNALASGLARLDAQNKTITVPPPPAAVVENGAMVEIYFPALNRKIGLIYGQKPDAQPDEFFGLDGSFSWGHGGFNKKDRLRSYLTIMQKSGNAWNRDRFRWHELHPKEDAPLDYNTINHTLYRRVASEMGIKTLDTFHQTPDWLRVADPKSPSHRDNPYPIRLKPAAEDWVKIVKNYQPTLQALEVWNEPDYAHFGKHFPADLVMSFTKAVSSKLREAGLETQIVGGAFMALHAGSVMQRGYIENGLLDSSDVVSWHTYRRVEVLQNPVVAWRKLAAQMHPERAGIPIWITEMGFPWHFSRKDLRRAEIATDIDSASEIAAKAAEYKALGIAKNIAFSYKWYNESSDNNGYGMMDANLTPMRTMASWATASKTLAHFEYVGDLRDTNARRARVFENARTGKSIAVLYHPVNEKSAIAHFTFPKNLTLEKVTGADGRALTVSVAGNEATVSHADGLAYLHFPSKPAAAFLDTKTPAMECFEMARDFKRRNPPRKTAPVVFMSALDLTDVVITEFGYNLKEFEDKRVEFTVQNLTDTAQTVRPALDLPAGMTATGFQEREHVLAPGENKTLSFNLTIDPSVKPGEYRMLRVIDRANNSQPLAWPIRAWQMEVVKVPAQGKGGASNASSASLPALLAEKDWHDFSSLGYWTPLPGGSDTPTIKAQFRALSYTKDTLRFQVLVRDTTLKLFDTPEEGIGGDLVYIGIQQRNPDDSVKKGAGTRTFYAFRTASKTDNPGKTYVMWYPHWRRGAKVTNFKNSKLQFQELGDNYYLYTLDLAAKDFEIDLKTGNRIGIRIRVDDRTGDLKVGYLSWGGDATRNGRLFNCFELE